MKVLGFFSLPLLLIGYLGDFADAMADPHPDLPHPDLDLAAFAAFDRPFLKRSERLLNEFAQFHPDDFAPDPRPKTPKALHKRLDAHHLPYKYDVDSEQAQDLARLARFLEPPPSPLAPFLPRQLRPGPDHDDLMDFLHRQGPQFLQERQGPEFLEKREKRKLERREQLNLPLPPEYFEERFIEPERAKRELLDFIQVLKKRQQVDPVSRGPCGDKDPKGAM